MDVRGHLWMREGGSMGATFSYFRHGFTVICHQTEYLNSVSEFLLLSGPLSTRVKIIVTVVQSPVLLQQQCPGKYKCPKKLALFLLDT